MAKLSAAEKQRRYRERRDADPQRRHEYLQKKKEIYARDIETGKRRRISETTPLTLASFYRWRRAVYKSDACTPMESICSIGQAHEMM